jgi:type I restriction enzyme S subunit
MATLGQVMDFQNGRAFKSSEWQTEGLPIIRIQNLNNFNAPFNYFNGAFDNRILVDTGDLLFSWSGTVGTSFGPHIWNRPQALLNQHIFKVKLNSTIEKRYAYYSLLSITSRIEENVNGSVGLTHITKTKLINFEIPLPSLVKQHEIVTKLDNAFADVDLSFQKTTESLEYLSSCFDSFLDKILKNQILEFGQKKMVDVLEIARGGSPRPISSYLTNDKDGVNWVKISDASSSKKYITETSQKIKPEGVSRSRLVNPGDFLLSNSMSFGRPYIMGTSGCVHDGWLVLSNDKKLLNQDYLYYVLGSKYIYDQFNRTAAGSTVRNLNISLAGQVTFPVPDLETQEALVSQLTDFETSIDELKNSMGEKLIKLLELKNSILSSAFDLNESLAGVA